MKSKIIINITGVFIVIVMLTVPVLSAEPHENPQTSVWEYSGLELFRYYSYSLDEVITKNVNQVELRFARIPFANVPPGIIGFTEEFSAAMIGCTESLTMFDKALSELRILLEQVRLSEADTKANQIMSFTSDGYRYLKEAEDAIQAMGTTFNVSRENPNSPLRLMYDEVKRKLASIKAMFDLYRKLEGNLLAGYVSEQDLSEIENTAELSVEKSISIVMSITNSRFPTEITLIVEPLDAFVGEDVIASGILTTSGQPLAERSIEIILDGVIAANALTSSDGSYKAPIRIPYEYTKTMTVQSLYYPRDSDSTTYLASLSPETILDVNFYEMLLSFTTDKMGYPGREMSVETSWTYLSPTPAIEREFQVFLDKVLIVQESASEGFVKKFTIPPDLQLGSHRLTVTAFATGRYAPGTISKVIDVGKAATEIKLDLPRIILIPGQVSINGIAESELGTLQGARVRVKVAFNTAEFFSGEDGSFIGNLKTRYGFGLVGSESWTLEVFPKEPWNLPYMFSQKVLLINGINCGILLTLLIVLSVIIPRRFKLREKSQSHVTTGLELNQRNLKPAIEPSNTTPSVNRQGPLSVNDMYLRSRIFSWYILLMKAVQKSIEIVLLPHQTLREFTYIARERMGKAAQYLIEFTNLVERLLYSKEQPTDGDLNKSEQLTRRVQESMKNEDS